MARYDLHVVTEGTDLLLASTTGSGHPRLFEGDGIYVYNITAKLDVTLDLATFNSVGPVGSTVVAIAQATSNLNSTEIIFVAGSVTSRYQITPVSAGAWSSGATVAANFVPIDMVADTANIIGILVGNTHASSEPRIEKSTQTAPFSFAQSDAGLPRAPLPFNTIARITDIDVAE